MDKNDFFNLFKDKENKKNTKDKFQEMTLAKNEHRKVVYEKSKEISLKADDKLEGMKREIFQMSGDELKKKFVDS